jgi:hypothetical protein
VEVAIAESELFRGSVRAGRALNVRNAICPTRQRFTFVE